MNDLYHRLEQNKSRKVTPRTNDGFVDSSQVSNPPATDNQLSNSQPSLSNSPQPLVDTPVPPSSQPKASPPKLTPNLVETSKSKLLTVEVKLRQELDQILYEHKDVSWDTLIEAALITSLSNPTTRKKTLKQAEQRLAARKQSAVYKRTQTMSQKYF
jgi:hypothetical protein